MKIRQALAAGRLVPDEMVRAFAICGKRDAVRARVERAWTVADSMCPVPPAHALPPEKLLAHGQAIAELFHGSPARARARASG